MTAIKCPHCKRVREYKELYDLDDYDLEDDNLGTYAVAMDPSEAFDFDDKRASSGYDAICPHCGEKFMFYKVYRFDHYEVSKDLYSPVEILKSSSRQRSLNRKKLIRGRR